MKNLPNLILDEGYEHLVFTPEPQYYKAIPGIRILQYTNKRLDHSSYYCITKIKPKKHNIEFSYYTTSKLISYKAMWFNRYHPVCCEIDLPLYS